MPHCTSQRIGQMLWLDSIVCFFLNNMVHIFSQRSSMHDSRLQVQENCSYIRGSREFIPSRGSQRSVSISQ